MHNCVSVPFLFSQFCQIDVFTLKSFGWFYYKILSCVENFQLAGVFEFPLFRGVI